MTSSGHSGFLKFEAWRELVGWERHLGVASQSTHPIVNTTLEAVLQTISRQLYAIFVVTLDEKVLGIVQLVGKGEGLEAWRRLKLEYEGKSVKETSCVVAGNSQPESRLGG